MKFKCTTEPYRHFMGRLFPNYQPVEVTDRATIEALEKHRDFVKVEEVEEKTELLPDVCPKCGRTVKRGKVMHAKYCKGR